MMDSVEELSDYSGMVVYIISHTSEEISFEKWKTTAVKTFKCITAMGLMLTIDIKFPVCLSFLKSRRKGWNFRSQKRKLWRVKADAFVKILF